MSTGVAAIERATGRRVLELLERDGLLIAVVAIFAATVTLILPSFVNQDTWLTLVSGREVVQHGLPGADTLTYWTLGTRWVDQQWLAQAILYGIYTVGGLKLLALACATVTLVSLAFSGYNARCLGAGSRATSIVTVAAAPLLFLISSQARTQVMAYPLFVLVLGLLLMDVRVPNRHVFISLPILVVWANTHGSVVLGATLVALRGAQLLLSQSTRVRGALLVAGSVIAVLATPYGLGVVSYYHDTIFNSGFKLLVEWRAPALSVGTMPLYAFAGAAIWLLGRYHSRFTSFERLALALLTFASFWALRNVVWLMFGAIPLLAPAVDEMLRRRQPGAPRTNRLLGLAASGLALVAILGVALRPLDAPSAGYPNRAEALIAHTAAQNPSIRIYANERYSDWLLFTHPDLRGRIAYDVRFELLSKAQLMSIVRFRLQATGGWRSAADGARLLVLNPESDSKVEKSLLRGRGTRRIYHDDRVSVLLREHSARTS